MGDGPKRQLVWNTAQSARRLKGELEKIAKVVKGIDPTLAPLFSDSAKNCAKALAELTERWQAIAAGEQED